MTDLGRIDAYDFELPERLIARRPPPDRDGARMLVIDRADRSITHAQFRDLPSYLDAGDVAVFNTTRVLPARLRGVREATGGKWEGLFLREEADGRWRLMSKTKGRIQPGEFVVLRSFGGDRTLRVRMSQKVDSQWLAEPETAGPVAELLGVVGAMPLPPYVGRETPDADDADRYQTVFAAEAGAVAAPTAGLHFTDETLRTIAERGVRRADVTLHVGVGTFRPVSAERLDDHVMHAEWARITGDACDAISESRVSGGKCLAVGTTAVRTLESAAAGGTLRPFEGETDLFIRPGFAFHAVDRMLTNFHLPRSTLLVLVSAFADRELMLAAYAEAVAREYRFFSYGDAMLIL